MDDGLISFGTQPTFVTGSQNRCICIKPKDDRRYYNKSLSSTDANHFNSG